MRVLTRHARKRLRQRSVGRMRALRMASRRGEHLGKGVYKVEKEDRGVKTVVVYKRRGLKRVILSAWKRRGRS